MMFIFLGFREKKSPQNLNSPKQSFFFPNTCCANQTPKYINAPRHMMGLCPDNPL